jgi:hypothetical protein
MSLVRALPNRINRRGERLAFWVGVGSVGDDKQRAIRGEQTERAEVADGIGHIAGDGAAKAREVGARLGERVGGCREHREAGLAAPQLVRDLPLCDERRLELGDALGLCGETHLRSGMRCGRRF